MRPSRPCFRELTGAVAPAGVDSTLTGALPSPLRSAAATRRGICDCTVEHASEVETDRVLARNTAKSGGSGLYNYRGSAPLTGCEVTENTPTNQAGRLLA